MLGSWSGPRLSSTRTFAARQHRPVRLALRAAFAARSPFRFAPAGARFHGGNPVSPVRPVVGVHKGREAGGAGLS